MSWTKPLPILALLTTAAVGVAWVSPGLEARSPLSPAVDLASPAAAAAAVEPQSAAAAIDAPPRPQLQRLLGQCEFVPNRGQWPAEVRFGAFGDTAGWLHDDGFTLRYERWSSAPAAPGEPAVPRTQSGCVVRTRFLGAETRGVATDQPVAGRRSFLCGNDPAAWVSDVEAFGSVRLLAVHPGIDVAFRPLAADERGPFEYDLLLAPGADLSTFAARCEGATALRIDAEGRLCVQLETPDGPAELVQRAPIAWQDTPAGRRPLPVAFRLLAPDVYGPDVYGFVAEGLDPALPATVDPGVVWGTYLGGGATETIHAVRWRQGVGVWVAGWTGSTNFPTTVGAYRTTGGADAFVARISETGTALVFATYIGGSGGDEIRGLDVGPGNTATVVGFTDSNNFPVTAGALQSTFGGGSPFVAIGDAFVSTLSANGSTLVASTYLGGLFDDVAEAVLVESSGAPVVVGWTSSGNFPSTPGVVQPGIGGFPAAQTDGFVCRLQPGLQALQFSTFLGGQLGEQLLAVDREPVSGDLLVVGWTLGTDWPVTPNALRPTTAGALDGVVARLRPNGTSMAFSTYLGGLTADALQAVRVASDGSVWVAGFTDSINFPTTVGSPQPLRAGGEDGCVVRLNSAGTSILFGSYFGGSGTDRLRGIAATTDGAIVVGDAGPGFPVTPTAVQTQFASGGTDGVVVQIDSGQLAWSSYLGGTQGEFLKAIDATAGGLAIIGGWTFSPLPTFPLGPPGFQPTRVGVSDGVVLQLDFSTDLSGGLLVGGPTGSPLLQSVNAGAHQLLAVDLTNTTLRPVVVDAVRVLLAGALPQQLTNVVVTATPTGAAAQVVAGPLALPVTNTEQSLQLTGCELPPGGQLRLVITGDWTNQSEAGAELAAAIVGPDAWTLRTTGVAGGPTVRVLGDGRGEGGALLIGRRPADADGDGRASAVDVRRLLAAIGTVDRGLDTDGDTLLTANDVLVARRSVLGRPTLTQLPAIWNRGSWVTIGGVFPDLRTVQASLGGRVVAVGVTTPRQVALRVDASIAAGGQELVLSQGGRVIERRIVQVQ